MPSIIPSPGSPGVAPNLFDTIFLQDDHALAAGETLFTTSLDVIFRNFGLETFYPDLVIDGEVWNQGAGNVYLVNAMNFGAIENHGLAVAQSSNGAAQAFYVSSHFEGLTNTGAIFALAPNGAAYALVESSGAEVFNSGLIAAQGRVATTIFRANGGAVVNAASGSILAEGEDAIAIVMLRGHYPGGDIDFVDIDNAGVIQAASTSQDIASVAIYLSSLSFERFTIHNSGVIAADFAVFVDEYFFSPAQSGDETIVNEASGEIRGVIYLASGDDVIVNAGVMLGYVYLDLDDDTFDNSAGELFGVASLGWGEDAFLGGAAVDAVVGDRGEDAISGGDGADLLLGGRGDDEIVGGAGNDGLFGEFGNDRIVTQGADRAIGGDGDDAIALSDLQFALADGGDGRDTLILPDVARMFDLSAALASGRLVGFEEIALPGAQELVVRAADVAASSGQQLVVSTTAAATVDLVGDWVEQGPVSTGGVQYRSFVSGAATVLVAGAGAVAVLAAAPGGASGLDPVAPGGAAPLPGSIPGADLTSSVTYAEGVDLTRSLTIDPDEQWISESGVAAITSSSGIDVALVNYGQIVSTGGADGASAVGSFNFASISNFGAIAASAAGNADDLALNLNHLAIYGLERAVQTIPGNVWGLSISGLVGPVLNAGTISASSEASVAVGYNAWSMHEGFRNEGTVSAESSMFLAVGVYAHNGGVLVNTGDIHAEGEIGAVGVGASTHQLTLDNQGSIVAIAHAGESIGVALYWQNFRQTILNSGTIDADIAIQTSQMINGGGVFLDNSGQITGRIELNVGPSGAPLRQDVIYNHGAIDGEVRLGGERDLYEGIGGTQIGAVLGEDGADILVGGASNETLNGGAGDDALRGGAGADALTGGAGADLFAYLAASDSTAASFDTILDFQTGVDRIDLSALSATSVTLGAGGGFTTLTAQTAGGALVVRISGAIAMSDVILAPQAVLQGGAGADTLVATTAGRTLLGEGGDDALVGSTGADTFDGGAGADLMWGGAGDDLYFVDDQNDAPLELPSQGVDSVIVHYPFGWGYYLPDNVENATYLDWAGPITGNALDNVITANAQNNSIDGGAGADTLIGGAGADGYRVDDELDVIVENPGEGEDAVTATATHTLSANVEHLTLAEFAGSIDATGNALDNIIAGNEGDNRISGEGGADTVWAGGGEDEIHGGAGADLLDGQADSDSIDGGDGDDVIWGERGNDVIAGGAGDDRLSGAARIIFDQISGTYRPTVEDDFASDSLDGGAGDDVLEGWGGDDRLEGGQGADRLEGGRDDDLFVLTIDSSIDAIFGGVEGADSGFDTVDYSSAAGAVIVQLAGYATTSAGVQVAALSGVEGAIGTAFNDALIGDAADNRLQGGAGADWLVGGGGDDWFVQGVDAGAPDRLFGDAGADTLDYGAAGAGVVVQLSGYSTSGGATLATFNAIENAVGSAFADVLVGDSANNVLSGGAGADWIVGASGDDTFVQGIDTMSVDRLFGDAGIDTLDYGAASAGVTVQLSGYSTSSGVTLATFNGIENAVGSAFNDAIVGNAAGNRITGGAGADWLVGGAGDDTFVQGSAVDGVDTIYGGTAGADSGFDTLDYSGAAAGVVVRMSGRATINDDLLAVFSGVEAAIGTAFDDTLIGAGANDELRGGAGADWIAGAAGSDRLFGGAGDDRFVLGLDAGVDAISGEAGFDTLDFGAAGAGIVVQLSGYATGPGGALLATFSGVENASGTAFDDTLVGDAGDNRLTGGAGADWLVGGNGDDVFVQGSAGGGVDRIFGGVAGADSGFDTIDYSGADTGVIVQLSGYATTAGGQLLALLSGIEAVAGSSRADALIGAAGDDHLVGAGGADWLVGAAGADDFIYQAVERSIDTIADFSRTQGDRIDLSAIDANPFAMGDQAFEIVAARTVGIIGQAVVVASATSTTVSLHLDADDIADMVIQVLHEPGLVMNATDFAL